MRFLRNRKRPSESAKSRLDLQQRLLTFRASSSSSSLRACSISRPSSSLDSDTVRRPTMSAARVVATTRLSPLVIPTCDILLSVTAAALVAALVAATVALLAGALPSAAVGL